jgi:hypothetical protein
MAERSFISPEGVAWQAWDVVPDRHPEWPAHARRHLPQEMASGWICFESDSEKRRMRPIPAGWELWTDEELRWHCLQAAPVIRPSAAGAEKMEPGTAELTLLGARETISAGMVELR